MSDLASPLGARSQPVRQPETIESSVISARSPRMVPHEIAFALALATRVPTVTIAARSQLSTVLFAPDEAKFVLFWRGVLAALDACGGKLPDSTEAAREIVALQCATEVAKDSVRNYYTPSVEKAVMAEGGLLDELFGLPIDAGSSETLGMSLLARFVTERKVIDPFRRAVAGLGSQDTLSDPTTMLATIAQHYREIAGLGVDPGRPAISDDIDYRPALPTLVTTKSRWLDRLMNGGQAAKECYVLLGPSGGGKTALGVQIAVEGAELQSAMAAELGDDCAGHWYYFTWELTEEQIQERIYAYGGRIHHDTYKHKMPYSTSERPETLRPYESDPFVNSPGNPLRGERERLISFVRRHTGSNRRLFVVDYSGTYPGHGYGGAEEIAGYLQREQTRGRRIAGVVIDYAKLAVEAYMAGKKLRPDALTTLLAGFVNQVRRLIAIPYDCSAWVLHQFHGAATRKAPGVIPHHSEALGCRNFADNCDFSIQLSNYNKNNGLMMIGSTKSRRAPGIDGGVSVQFDGRFGVFNDTDQQYILDPTTRQIIPRDYLHDAPLPTGGAGAFGPVDPLAGL